MLCPIVSEKFRVGECITDRCGWWDRERDKCALLSMVSELRETWRAQDNLAREISNAILRKK